MPLNAPTWRHDKAIVTAIQQNLEARYKAGQQGIYERACPVCGVTFYTDVPTQKYCFVTCKQSANDQTRRANRKPVTHENVCAICHKTFTSKRSGAQYCSPACKQLAYRRKNKPLPIIATEEQQREGGQHEPDT